MQTQLFDNITDTNDVSFRLQKLEVYNWGTFDKQVWTIMPGCKNSLLTGDIGSGKSTIVDAITTLLIAHNRIVFNKAAGAESKERTLYSYVRGEYKTEKDECSQAAKSVSLRDKDNYTVLLAHFDNPMSGIGICLAQVFWLKDSSRNPERFFVISTKTLSIAENFSDFGKDILQLKKRLRNQQKIEVFDRFKDYSQRFRYLLGINNEKALDLFYQTVSLKSVGNLTSFVQNHMLDKDNIESQIESLCHHFDDLNRAHEAVLKARQQIEYLNTLMKTVYKYKKNKTQLEHSRTCRELLPNYIAMHQKELLEDKLKQIISRQEKSSRDLESSQHALAGNEKHQRSLQASIEAQGGKRLQEIENECQQLQNIQNERMQQAKKYHQLAKILQLNIIKKETPFYTQREQAQKFLINLESKLQTVQNESVDIRIELKDFEKQHQEIDAEIKSLAKRASNIPAKTLELRDKMANTLGLTKNDFPFVGELLQVRTTELEWEGALERLLHGFGLSILVPDHFYNQVSRYVDKTHLQGRLIYFRASREHRKPARDLRDKSLVFHKLNIKPNNQFYDWLRHEISEKFDYRCCNNISEFHRLPRAITIQGQIKSNQRRHEKDDRFALNDRRRFILGWQNKDKIALLKAQLIEIAKNGEVALQKLKDLHEQQSEKTKLRDTCRDLLSFTDFKTIDWHSTAKSIEQLNEEANQIRDSSDVLKTLQNQLEQAVSVYNKLREKEKTLLELLGRLSAQQEHYQNELNEANSLIIDFYEKIKITLNSLFEKSHKSKTLELRNMNVIQTNMYKSLKGTIDNLSQTTARQSQKIIQQMNDYKHLYPNETNEVDIAIEAISEFESMLQSLEQDDLPKHELKFKELLHEGTINSIALLQSKLDKSLREIYEKIDIINDSLRTIEYNPGTYIKMMTDKASDPEIRDFQHSLRECLSNTLSDETYTEDKFLQVKKLISRFNGREGLAELDKKWMKKVTDVRNWLLFSASERWLHDDNEKEYYSDSSGKSGGQKEKLAYTILASALTYQFGLNNQSKNSRQFRFVMIDEAFGKGSDESTRYALDLFKKLDLQLLIVTPLQKIHIIENYVKSVHFIYNEGGANSMIRNLTIHEYQEQKQATTEKA